VPPRETEWPLRALVGKIEEHVRPFLDTYRDIDVIGKFYGEFLRYTGGDKKGLGIVLTPRHLTELFVKMARVGLKDTVIDTCCGTSGFLISAPAEMDAKADGDPDIRNDIRKHRLVGVEQQPQMFALAASNMILRGDGKANLFQGNCFDPELIEKLKNPEKEAIPNFVATVPVDRYEGLQRSQTGKPPPDLNVDNWQPFTLSDLFELKKGRRLTKSKMTPGATPVHLRNRLQQRAPSARECGAYAPSQRYHGELQR
jgi:type I restriction-modification system DNA methylase subunit